MFEPGHAFCEYGKRFLIRNNFIFVAFPFLNPMLPKFRDLNFG